MSPDGSQRCQNLTVDFLPRPAFSEKAQDDAGTFRRARYSRDRRYPRLRLRNGIHKYVAGCVLTNSDDAPLTQPARPVVLTSLVPNRRPQASSLGSLLC